MKTPDLPEEKPSAVDKRNFTIGTLPYRLNTVAADVLSGLLESKAMTGIDSVFKQNTTRLAAHIEYLERKYGWHIERRDVVTGTNDGRIATIVAYWLSQAAIAKAFEAGARDWIESVKVARAARRKESAKCKAQAAKANARRKLCKPQDPRQDCLWGNA